LTSLVVADAFAGELTHGSIGTIPATTKLKVHGHIREVYGRGTWIRTKIDGVRVRDFTVENATSKYAVISERYLAAQRGFELRTAT
jgi:hypothetical protein